MLVGGGAGTAGSGWWCVLKNQSGPWQLVMEASELAMVVSGFW